MGLPELFHALPGRADARHAQGRGRGQGAQPVQAGGQLCGSGQGQAVEDRPVRPFPLGKTERRAVHSRPVVQAVFRPDLFLHPPERTEGRLLQVHAAGHAHVEHQRDRMSGLPGPGQCQPHAEGGVDGPHAGDAGQGRKAQVQGQRYLLRQTGLCRRAACRSGNGPQGLFRQGGQQFAGGGGTDQQHGAYSLQ